MSHLQVTAAALLAVFRLTSADETPYLRGGASQPNTTELVPEASEDTGGQHGDDVDENCEYAEEYCGDIMTYELREDCSADNLCRVHDMGDHFQDVPKGEAWLCGPADKKCDRNFSREEFQSMDEVPEDYEGPGLGAAVSATWGVSTTCTASRCGFYDSSAACQCNEHCTTFGNCCANYKAVCASGGGDDRGTCEGRSCFQYVKSATCQCNELCTKYSNCCHDYKKVCDPSDKPKGDKWSSPGIGVGGETMTLYHTTSLKVANLIVKGGFRPGKSGWCGGAIYFINHPHLPRSKYAPGVTKSGAILEAKVEMGRMATHFNRRCQGYGGGGVSAARRAGFNSLKFNPGDGDEFIIWNPKQVLSVRIYQKSH